MTDRTAQQMVDFGPQTRIVARLADGVGEDQLDLATPCPEYAVHNLLGHILGLTVAFGDADARTWGRRRTRAPRRRCPTSPTAGVRRWPRRSTNSRRSGATRRPGRG